MPEITSKRYRCSHCGHVTFQSTNHYGQTYSFGRVNRCSECGWKRPLETTVWECLDSEHYTIPDIADYNRIRDGLRDLEFWRNGRNGYHVSEVPQELRWIDNRLRSAVEHWEFIQNPPAAYFAYVKLHDRSGYNMLNCQAAITTWTGQLLGAAFLGKPYQDNFGGTRQSVSMEAINGRRYHGTYYRSSGDYCRLKLSKKGGR